MSDLRDHSKSESRETILPFGYLPPMSRHCALGFCSKIGPCSNNECSCECHDGGVDE